MNYFGKFGKICGKLCLAIAVAGCLAVGSLEAIAKDEGLGNHGRISHNHYKPGQTASCSIAKMPTTEAEFDALQAQIGTEPQGGVMCFLAAQGDLFLGGQQGGGRAALARVQRVGRTARVRRVRPGDTFAYAS
ncbi:MAG: hypothetical protein K6G50_00110 [bacterium]|nr:hypothetical protein [bacterium]